MEGPLRQTISGCLAVTLVLGFLGVAYCQPALLDAARTGDRKAVETALEDTSNRPERNELSQALWWSASEGHADIVSILLDTGVNPNSRFLDESTPVFPDCRPLLLASPGSRSSRQ